jgi:hypothetical protein
MGLRMVGGTCPIISEGPFWNRRAAHCYGPTCAIFDDKNGQCSIKTALLREQPKVETSDLLQQAFQLVQGGGPKVTRIE